MGNEDQVGQNVMKWGAKCMISEGKLEWKIPWRENGDLNNYAVLQL